jgi:hypothetical protein
MTKPVDIRAGLVDVFGRDLVGPTPQDADLARERLNENPSRWYLTGFLAPADDPLGQDGPEPAEGDPSIQEEMETDVEEPVDDGAGGAAGDAEAPEAPNTKRRFLPSSVGLTVLLPPSVTEIDARVCWGDYRTEPPLPEAILLPDEPKETDEDGKPKKNQRPVVELGALAAGARGSTFGPEWSGESGDRPGKRGPATLGRRSDARNSRPPVRLRHA